MGFEKPSRRRKWFISVARSPFIYVAARMAVMLVFFAGMLLMSFGFFKSISSYVSSLTALEIGGPVSVNRPRPTPTANPWAGFIPMQIDPEQNIIAPPVAVVGDGTVPAEAAGEQNQPAAPDPGISVPLGTEMPPIPTSTPPPPGPPERLVIPSIELDAPVERMPIETVRVEGHVYKQWQAPGSFAVGWQDSSAQAGAPGNTVLNGHHNVHGMVFGRLFELEQGDRLLLYSGARAYPYVVSQVMVLEERFVGIDQRLENARWILPSNDTRLTLVTCWPPESNTHRLIVIAVPTN